MEDFNKRKGFDTKRFEADHFGYGRYDKPVGAKSDRWIRHGFFKWTDVARYLGISPTVHINERELRNGTMTKTLYENLCHLYGKETIDEYFPHPEKPKVSKEDQEIDDIVTMMFGSASEVSEVMRRHNY